MVSLLETLTSIVIASILLSLIFFSTKLAKDKEKLITEMLRETGTKFEIFLKFKCYENKDIEINVDNKKYLCGFGRIKKIED